jgi:hypothetical protein
VRFARLIQRHGRDLGVPSARAAFGGNLILTWLYVGRDERRTAEPGPRCAVYAHRAHWYGVASVKWLKRIDVITDEYEGEFQVGHYMYERPDQPHEPVTLMRVRARITDPAPDVTLPAGT